MGKYTVHNEEIDDKIQLYLDYIVDEILKKFPNLYSLFLIGGFGRGEGSVIIDENCKVRPLKDFDFLLIFEDKYPPISLVEELQNSLRLKLNNGKVADFTNRLFTVDININILENINAYQDIVTYELKTASHLLYGKDIRNNIKIKKKDVPLRSGLRILFQKGISLIGQMSYEYLRNGIPLEYEEMFFYEVSKVFVELGTALSILGQIYEPSYSKRGHLLVKNYENLFPELYKKIPNLGRDIEYFTNIKLNPNNRLTNKDPIDLWFTARNYLLITIEYYMKNYLKVTHSENFLELCENARKSMKKEYYTALIANYTYEKWKIKPKRTLPILNKAFQLYGRFCYFRNINRNQNYGILMNTNLSCPTINFFHATLLMLNSIDEKGNLNYNNFNLVKNKLNVKPKYQIDSNWNDLRQLYLDSLSFLPYIY